MILKATTVPHFDQTTSFRRAALLTSLLVAGCHTGPSLNESDGGADGGDGGSNDAGQDAGACGCSTSCCSGLSTASSTENGGGIYCGSGEYCYGGWYCSFAVAGDCTQADPCNGDSGVYVACPTDMDGGNDGGPRGSGPIGPDGGQVPTMTFGVLGDARPADKDPSNVATAYPSEVISYIFQDIQASSPLPQFVIATGDYAYCDTTCTAQTALFLAAASNFSGQIFPIMGNHECNGDTDSNCGPGNVDGITANYSNFLSNVLGANGITPALYPSLANQAAYYTVNINSSPGVTPIWNAKFVMIAANAWDMTQQMWLQNAMQQPTTYTFVVRHESVTDEQITTNCPGDCGASDTVINQYPYTALLVGHSHEYRQAQTASGQVELIVGNGGAPLDESNDFFGYVICTQLADGNISCQPYDSGAYGTPVGSPVVMNAAGAIQQ